MECDLLPLTAHHAMSDLTLGPRAQRAVILAHTGDFTAADAEMAQLEHYNLTPEQAEEIGNQRP